jgi:hypothetical protein
MLTAQLSCKSTKQNPALETVYKINPPSGGNSKIKLMQALSCPKITMMRHLFGSTLYIKLLIGTFL